MSHAVLGVMLIATFLLHPCHLPLCAVCSDPAVSAKLPIHCFVNDMDVVPRLLESSKIMAVLQAVQPLLPRLMHKTVAHKATCGGSFVSIGKTYLLLNDSVQVFDTKSEAATLLPKIEQLFERISGRSQQQSDREVMVSRLVQDHQLVKYTSKIRAAVLHTVPVLFNGGQRDDYEAVPIKHISPSSGMFCVTVFN